MKHLHIIILLLLLSSCRTQYIPLPEIHHRDSLVTRVNTRVDSIREYVRDSMSIRFGKVSSAGGNGIPDTVYIDRWHTAYKDRWRVNARVDTIRVTTHDTITVPVPVPSPALSSSAALWGRGAMKWWGRGFLLGGIGAVVLLFLLRIATRLYLRR